MHFILISQYRFEKINRILEGRCVCKLSFLKKAWSIYLISLRNMPEYNPGLINSK